MQTSVSRRRTEGKKLKASRLSVNGACKWDKPLPNEEFTRRLDTGRHDISSLPLENARPPPLLSMGAPRATSALRTVHHFFALLCLSFTPRHTDPARSFTTPSPPPLRPRAQYNPVAEQAFGTHNRTSIARPSPSPLPTGYGATHSNFFQPPFT